MSRHRPDLASSPSRSSSSSNDPEQGEDHTLEGVAANVLLLLKLIQDHNEAKDGDDRMSRRVAGMMAIIDDVRSRIQKKSSSGSLARRKDAELRRCLTDLRPRRSNNNNNISRAQGMTSELPGSPTAERDPERLKKQLNASLAARKNLELMCSSVGKEKEIMATELVRKAHELNGMEELLNDLKAQNAMLLSKVQACKEEHNVKKSCTEVMNVRGNHGALEERNRELSDQILKSLDGYKSLKRKLKDAQEDKMRIRASMEEVGEGILSCLDRVRVFQNMRATVAGRDDKSTAADEAEIAALEESLKGLVIKVSQCVQRKSMN